ncbi:hypothetical protein EC973_002897 [Apophysomyces ossiformis]|uniref:Uncharacterized protein n=1 Tax=Apophysomyces ossiformis TaxID=679940 RepID=A0A8H7ENC9_9FUNG|nr:hypothetical protein EC973_002897 [Apophysomyces ossiformis]
MIPDSTGSRSDTTHSKLTSSLSIFVPRRNERQSLSSLRSDSTGESSSAAEHALHSQTTSPWSHISFEPISDFAQRASSSSISILNASASAILHPVSLANVNNTRSSSLPDTEEERLRDATQRVMSHLLLLLKLSLNDRSIGFYRISEHMRKRVPQLVEDKHKLKQLTNEVSSANSDITDVRKQVATLERMESFHRIGKMISTSIQLAKEVASHEKEKKRIK